VCFLEVEIDTCSHLQHAVVHHNVARVLNTGTCCDTPGAEGILCVDEVIALLHFVASAFESAFAAAAATTTGSFSVSHLSKHVPSKMLYLVLLLAQNEADSQVYT
jgi:hypothetical protein